MFGMTVSLSQYEKETIFPAFVDVIQCIFVNALNVRPNVFISFSLVVGSHGR